MAYKNSLEQLNKEAVANVEKTNLFLTQYTTLFLQEFNDGMKALQEFNTKSLEFLQDPANKSQEYIEYSKDYVTKRTQRTSDFIQKIQAIK